MRAALLMALLLCASAAPAATVTVSPGATPGLAEAARALQPGDTLLLGAGTYPGGLSLSLKGTAAHPITLRAAGDGPVIIEGRTEVMTEFAPALGQRGVYMTPLVEPPAGVGLDLPDSPWVIHDLPARASLAELSRSHAGHWYDPGAKRLYFRYDGGASPAWHVVWVLRDGYGMALTGEHVRLEGLTFRRFAAQGLRLDAAREVSVRQCTVSHCGVLWSAGIQISRSEGVRVEDCVLFRVRNGLIVQEATGTQVQHCTIYATAAHGVYLIAGSGAVLRDNILCAGGRSGSALYVDARAAGGLQADHNCYLDTGSHTLISWMPLDLRFPTFWDYRLALPGQDQHSLSADPQFVSVTPGSEEFRLHPDSPCRGRASDGGDLGVRWR